MSHAKKTTGIPVVYTRTKVAEEPIKQYGDFAEDYRRGKFYFNAQYRPSVKSKWIDKKRVGDLDGNYFETYAAAALGLERWQMMHEGYIMTSEGWVLSPAVAKRRNAKRKEVTPSPCRKRLRSQGTKLTS
jgi:hypothetical protein